MPVRQVASLLLAVVLLKAGAPAASRYMSVGEVKPGMTGVGRTVFQGTVIEDFKVQVIGVLRNTNGPKRDLILARIEGGPLAKTGVIAGMSGSPVYIDGRLLGAVAYSLGQFATEPIAGITPIEEMISATKGESGTPTPTRRPAALPAAAAGMVSAFENALGHVAPFASSAAHVSYAGPAGPYDGRIATALRPLATPLTAGGFDAAALQPLVALFERAGFVLAPGGAPSASQIPAPGQSPSGPLRPGDPVGVALITGDLSMGATGTVTEVDGNRVYAFGHPFYNVGPARFPMTRAYVHAVLPSLLSSIKLASIGDVVGVVEQDRAAAVQGTLGPAPRTITVNLSLDRAGLPRRALSFDVVDHPLLTPLLVYTALFNTLSSHERDYGAGTCALTGRAAIRGQPDVEFDETYVGEQPGVAASAAVVAPIGALLNNDRERVDIESISLTIASAEQPLTATIERVWIDAAQLRPGRSVALRILLRTWRGDDVVHTVSVPIPLNGGGPLTLLVTDGPRLTQWETRDSRPVIAPDSVAALIGRLNDTRHTNRVYVRLLRNDPGAVVNGLMLPGLPSSILRVLDGDRAGGGGASLQQATIGAWEIRTPFAVSGQRTLTLSLGGSQRP